MANPNVLKTLEKIEKEIAKLAHHVKLYGGVDSSKKKAVLRELHSISHSCDIIAHEANS